MSNRPLRVILFGLGPIGLEIARVLIQRTNIEIAGAVDIDPAKAGRDLGILAGLREPMGILVSGDSKPVLKRAGIVIHATGSRLQQVLPQLELIASSHHSILSTCEELADPWAQHAADARRLEALAKEHGIAILGTGINPGYAMDTLPLMLTAMCQSVKKVRVRRVVDASKRRVNLQKKIGAGLTAAEFRERAGRGEIQHVGLLESVSLIARGLGWELTAIQGSIEPVLAVRQVRTDYTDVPPNFVTGVKQKASGQVKGEPVIELELHMTVDAPGSVDEAWIDGTPNLHSRVEGIHGDLSTAAVVANAVRRLASSPPGLLTMIDLPIVTAR